MSVEFRPDKLKGTTNGSKRIGNLMGKDGSPILGR